jgi:small-conductance mechanosensitive channel
MMKRSPIIFSLMLLGALFVLTSCGSVVLPDMGETLVSDIQETGTASPTPAEEEIIITPTPQPTATPGVIDRSVAEISAETGLDRQVYLGLTGEDWINLGISVLIFIIGTLLLSRIVHFVLRLIVRSTPSKRDDEFIAAIRRHINILISVLVVNFATDRLAFIPVFWKETLRQIYFTILIIVIAAILWKLIDLYFNWHRAKVAPEGQVDHGASLRYLFRRFLRALVVIAAFTVILSNYGINITFILAVVAAVAIALLFAGQDMLSDMIYGFILLFDQPFGVGDRIEIKELSTWGNVVEIGMRTTSVLTRDNRLVIYPNSIIGRSQVINYSLPDALLRAQIEFEMAYGEDPEQVEAVIVDAVSKVDGVAENKPVDVLLMKVSKNGLTFRLRWWLQNYQDGRYAADKVLRAVYAAMLQTGIELSLNAYDINIFMDSTDIQPDSTSGAKSEE